MSDFFSNRRQDNIDESERREHVVKVRLNDAELSTLDTARGHISKSETFRFLLLQKMPPAVPPINKEAWLSLSKAAANLNQIARHLNQSDKIEAMQIMAELGTFRDSLIGAKS